MAEYERQLIESKANGGEMELTTVNGHETYIFALKKSARELRKLKETCARLLGKEVHISIIGGMGELARVDAVRGVIREIHSQHSNKSLLIIKEAEVIGRDIRRFPEFDFDISLVRVIEHNELLCVMGCNKPRSSGLIVCRPGCSGA